MFDIKENEAALKVKVEPLFRDTYATRENENTRSLIMWRVSPERASTEQSHASYRSNRDQELRISASSKTKSSGGPPSKVLRTPQSELRVISSKK